MDTVFTNICTRAYILIVHRRKSFACLIFVKINRQPVRIFFTNENFPVYTKLLTDPSKNTC